MARNRNVSLSRLPSKPVRHDETQLSSCSPARLYEPAQHNRCRFLLPRLQLAALAHANNDAISAPPCQRRQPLGIGPSGKLPHPAPLRASSQNHTHAKVSSMSVPASGFLRLARKRRVFLFGGFAHRSPRASGKRAGNRRDKFATLRFNLLRLTQSPDPCI